MFDMVFISSEAIFRKYMFICTLNVQTYALEIFKKVLRKTNLPHGWLSVSIESEHHRIELS